MAIGPDNPFKGRQHPGDLIILCVRWYLQYPLSYQRVAELVAERGVEVDAGRIWRWVQPCESQLNNAAVRIGSRSIRAIGSTRPISRSKLRTSICIERWIPPGTRSIFCSPPGRIWALPNAFCAGLSRHGAMPCREQVRPPCLTGFDNSQPRTRMSSPKTSHHGAPDRKMLSAKHRHTTRPMLRCANAKFAQAP